MEKTFDKINYAKLVRRIFLVLFDIIFINLSSFLALFIRLEFDLVALEESGFVISLLKCAPFNTVLTFVLFMLFGLYNSLWEFAGIYEFQRIASASALSGVLQFCLMKILNLGIPRSFPVIYIFLLCFFYRGFALFVSLHQTRDLSRKTCITQENDAYWSRRCRRAGYTRISEQRPFVKPSCLHNRR